ncbi:hypothetical protein BCR33DRAFT_765591, partial [Rhizoclosmatium globosum]
MPIIRPRVAHSLASDHPSSSSSAHFAILGLLNGITLEVGLLGIVATLLFHRFYEKTPKLSITGILLINFNMACLFYMANFSSDWFLKESNCQIGNLFGNMASHYFYLSFDAFILFKSFVFSKCDHNVFRVSCILFVHRLFWTIYDIVKSTGEWDPLARYCNYNQNGLSGLGYNASDILIDSFCSIVALLFSWQYLNSDITRIGEVILSENVLRSVCVLFVNSFAIYASLTINDPFMTLITFMLQNYIYARCVNFELFWIITRRRNMVKISNTSNSSNN